MSLSLLNSIVLFTTLSASLGCILAATPAQASFYRSESGNTILRMNELTDQKAGGYSTQVNGTRWNGTLNIPLSNVPRPYPGGLRYKGTFIDSPVNDSSIQCTGDLDLDRKEGRPSIQFRMEMTWTVKGGKNCPSIGQSFTVTLPEALPKPDRNGDYNESWNSWIVTSGDGKLNCRATANGKVIHTYKANDVIFLDGRLGETIRVFNGDPWMYVPYLARPYTAANYKPCYVRANSQYITPMALPY